MQKVWFHKGGNIMTDIDWSKAPEGATHYDTAHDVYPWIKCQGDSVYFWYVDVWDLSCLTNILTANLVKRPGISNVKPVFTQKMADAGELPSVGMECMVIDNSLMNHVYEKCVILFVGIYKVVYTSDSCVERFSNIDEVKFKPIDTRTDEEKAFCKYWDSIEYATGVDSHKSAMKKAFNAGVKWGVNDET